MKFSLVLFVALVQSAFASDSCYNRCNSGYNPSDDCQCDENCQSYDNCCSDYQQQCVARRSCAGRCGQWEQGECGCDSGCEDYDDCCEDYESECKYDSCAGRCGRP